MNNNLSSIYLVPDKKNIHSFHILDRIHVNVEVKQNPYDIPLHQLFGMAARINKKRSFLFVSKVLGKHLPVLPAISLLTGSALSARLMEVMYKTEHPYKETIINAIKRNQCAEEVLTIVQEYRYHLPKDTVFIGFAETATALGHSLFNNFQNAKYLHTTREEVADLTSLIDFEEEHSHATAHRCYADASYLNNNNPVVLVDDEITTGKTTLNIIEAIQKAFPREEYIIISILDWRSEQNISPFRELEKKLGIRIYEISLISGTIKVEGEPFNQTITCFEEKYRNRNGIYEDIYIDSGELSKTPYTSLRDQDFPFPSYYLSYTGRFGLSYKEKAQVDHFITSAANVLKQKRIGNRTLCLGTGEFMYLPMRIAAEMGAGVYYQSTTRSPIHTSKDEGYAITNKFSYVSPEDPTIMNFLYNIPNESYDDVFLFLERQLPTARIVPIVNQLKKVFSKINIVRFGRKDVDIDANKHID